MEKPDEVLTDSGVGVEHLISEDVKFLEEDDTKVNPPDGEKKDEEKVEEKKDGLPDEIEEVKEEEKEKSEELEEVTDKVVDRPSFKEITTKFDGKYKDFFKDFPAMRDMYFREQEYTKVLPTIEDAKEAVETVGRFNRLDELVTEASPDSIGEVLNVIKEADKDAYEKFIDNFVPALAKADPEMQYRIATPIIDRIVKSIYQVGVRLGEDEGRDLRNSALQFANYLFNDPEIATGKQIKFEAPKENPDEKKFKEEREAFHRERYVEAVDTVATFVENKLKSEVEKSLENSGLNNYTRNKLIQDVFDKVDATLAKDRMHVSKMESLWKNARTQGLSREAKNRCATAYLSRARQLYPEIRNKLLSEALSDAKQRSEDTLERSKKRNEISSGGQQRFARTVTDPKQVDYTKTSDMDILNDKVTLRR